ncbi:SCA7, zinc-binding domain-containing protein [Crassisporium funariophilum]|nr:SCA7, zinc-binding domain-containing protein [Crassisporium funariophilum]
MTLKLKPTASPPLPFTWDLQSPSPTPLDTSSLPSPPTSWLSARDMKLFGARPLTSTSDIGLVKCKECGKPVLRSFMGDHADNCLQIRSGVKKGAKAKIDAEDAKKGSSKKRKASPSPDEPAKKKNKPATKVTKGRMKGPVDYDKQCGVIKVINDKNVPCSRSLTCKSHSMGAKRAVQGRSRNYDELLLEWQRAHNPNFVEPVKRETKAEKKEKREKEKLEKKRLAGEAAAALGLDPAAAGKKSTATSSSKKIGKKAAAAVAAAVRLAEEMRDDVSEDLDDLDSEVEVEDLIRSVRTARENGVISVPLAVPCDAGSWFVQRRERARCCRDLLLNALGTGGGTGAPGGIGSMGLANRSTSLSLNTGGTAMRLA